MSISTIYAPQNSITLADAKVHLRILHDDEDVYISALVSAAENYILNATGRVLCSGTFSLPRNTLRSEMTLPVAPVLSIKSLTLNDTAGNGTEVAAANYALDTTTTPPSLFLKTEGEYPTLTLERRGAVEIQFIAGYGDPSDVPQSLKHAVLLLVGHWYENRSSVEIGTIATRVPFAVDALLAPFKVYSIEDDR